ncbi:hypothetical protein [Nocardia sp. NPDC050435]|uniref:competence protein CoiA family protein n=1 Tax=Nocardia sp. NPDC050435 TaxID=3155040 RepID=UPI0033F17266
MGESNTDDECFASAMNAALGRYNEFIDVRDPEVFATWHHTPGLRCLVCKHPVTAYRSRSHNPFVRHGKGAAAQRSSAAARSAHETFLHYRLKYWVRDQLRACGSTDAEVEVSIGDRRPDVFGNIAGRGYAVEIQWSPLDYLEARTRTHELKAAGAENVLWLTRSCNWVELLPALGIKNFDPPRNHYRAHTGYLARGRRGGLYVTEISVQDVLAQWAAGDVAWAYRDHYKAGWATVSDWEQHTKQQAAVIADQNRKLEAATTLISDQAHELETAKQQKQRLEDQRDELLDDKSLTQRRIETLRQSQVQASRTHTRELEAASKRAQELVGQGEQLQAKYRAALGQIKMLRDELASLKRALALLRPAAVLLVISCLVLGVFAWLT